MRVVIFGATGPTGRLVVERGLERGYEVTAVSRNQAAIKIVHPGLRVVQGDVYDAASVEHSIEGQEAVISVYGVPYSFKPITVYSVGIGNIIRAMQKQDVKRLVCVTSGGTYPGYDSNAGFVFSALIKPIIGRSLYADMRLMEKRVMKSELDWTIVRPARLTDDPNPGTYRVGVAYSLPQGRITRRVALADFLIKEAAARQYVRQGVAIASNLTRRFGGFPGL